jgi:hypothetical protein
LLLLGAVPDFSELEESDELVDFDSLFSVDFASPLLDSFAVEFSAGLLAVDDFRESVA